MLYGRSRPLGIILIALVVVGCTANQPHMTAEGRAARARIDAEAAQYQASQLSAPPPATTTKIQIISEPPGARIEVNESYVGDAPCTVEVAHDFEGRFAERTTIRALPRDSGFTQTKFFVGFSGAGANNPYLHSDPIPARIFFDMRLEPVSPQIDVNVNQN